MNDPAENPLRELSLRRKLTAADEARLQQWLAEHPEDRPAWEAEAGLNRLLGKLQEAPAVSSNFTSLVVQAVEREAAGRTRRGWNWRLLPVWVPRFAVPALALVIGVVSYQRHVENNRVAMARSVTQVSGVVSASNPDVIENFNAIRWLGDLQPKGDTELYALME